MRCHTPRLLLTGCAAVWLATATSPLAGDRQLPGQRATPTAAPEGDVLRVTAVVTNRRGQPITGLTAGDFDLFVDGNPQTVDRVDLVDARAVPRVFAFLLDEFHTEPAGSGAVRESLLAFVERHLAPADLAVVVKPLDPLTSLTPTADREGLRRAIATFEGRKGQYTPRTDFERNYMAQAPPAVASARAQIVTSALRAIGVSLSRRESTSRPVIVLVSDGFGRSRASRDVPADLQSAIRIVNRAEAPVYAFAPALAPPQAGGPAGDDSAFSALATVTTQTGGALTTGPDALARGLPAMIRALAAHYVLTYRAPHEKDGRFHTLKVGVRRAGAEVRASGGYLAHQPPGLQAESSAPRGPARVLRRSPLIQSWTGFSPAAPGRGTVTLTWEPAPPRGASPRVRATRLAVTASTTDGTTLFESLVGPAHGLPSAGMPGAAMFDAPLGTVHLDIKVLDDKGVVLDIDARDVRPPNTRAGLPTIYPPAVLRTRSAREFREVSVDAAAPPAAGRDFRRTDRLLLRITAVDPAGNRTPVDAVLLNRLRQPMRTLPALEGADLGLATQFDLPLAPLPPGEYSVRLSVNAPAGVVSEYVTFRVLG